MLYFHPVLHLWLLLDFPPDRGFCADADRFLAPFPNFPTLLASYWEYLQTAKRALEQNPTHLVLVLKTSLIR